MRIIFSIELLVIHFHLDNERSLKNTKFRVSNGRTTLLFSQHQFSNNGCLTPQTMKVSKYQEREVPHLALLIKNITLQASDYSKCLQLLKGKDNREIYSCD